MTRVSLVLGLGVLVGSVPAYGHHSFAAFYLEDQTISVEGHVAEFDYRNPHVWVHVLAEDSAGQVQKVGAEWGNPGRLSQQGISRSTVKPGDWVIITGSPARDSSERKMHLKRIERPADGWSWVGRGDRR